MKTRGQVELQVGDVVSIGYPRAAAVVVSVNGCSATCRFIVSERREVHNKLKDTTKVITVPPKTVRISTCLDAEQVSRPKRPPRKSV